mmetsp:Transcript_18624/g.74866  ORF Transcript_18624/g.74866 Transcript_18624/m.74866 type:complete len:211 (+) Transcript_18624:560-1192(+)
MVVLRKVERRHLADFRNNRTISVGLQDFAETIPRVLDSRLLFWCGIIRYRPVLTSDIVTLSIQSSRVVTIPKRIQNLAKANNCGVVNDPYDFSMSRSAGAHLLVRWLCIRTTPAKRRERNKHREFRTKRRERISHNKFSKLTSIPLQSSEHLSSPRIFSRLPRSNLVQLERSQDLERRSPLPLGSLTPRASQPGPKETAHKIKQMDHLPS